MQVVIRIIKTIRRFFFRSFVIIKILLARFVVFFSKDNEPYILLGAMNGSYFGDNSAHLYNWLLQNEKLNYKPIWITRSRRVYKNLNSAQKPVLLAWSFKAIRISLISKAFYFTNSISDVVVDPRLIPKNARVVYLTHDIAPKRSRHARVGHKLSLSALKRSELEKTLVTDYISTSEFMTTCRSVVLDVDESRFVVTGLPRTDYLHTQKNIDDKDLENFLPNKDVSFSKVILYAPTWRSGREATKIIPFDDLNIKALANLLLAKDAILLLRCHKNDLAYPEVRARIKELVENGQGRIIDATHNHIEDINYFLPNVDLLISDYSGIIHDFLFLDRPIILLPYDYASFSTQNGFFYDYFNLAPGAVVDDADKFLSELESYLSNPEKDSDKRQKLSDLIFLYHDDKACQRVINLLDRDTKKYD